MIELNHISKTFSTKDREVNALKDVSLRIEDGDIYGIIGFSGAGKSTLVRCINLLEKPDQGEVLIDGTDLTKLSARELRQARRKIGMIFQHFNLMPSRTIAQNVLYPLAKSGLSKAEKQKKAAELLELVELSDKANAYPAQLSGGQKQRAAIARALANDPQILLCDEATSALDPITTRSILKLLKKVNEQLGVTLVIITHQMDVVKEICSHAAVMENGVCVEQGSTFEIFANPSRDVTRRFLHTTTNLKKIDEILEEDPEAFPLEKNQQLVRFTFLERNATQPFLARLSLDYQILVNITYADIEYVQGSPIGGTVAILEGERENIEKGLDFMKARGIQTEVLKYA